MAIQEGGGTLGGMPVIQGTRIGVHHITEKILHGEHTVESITTEVYPHLTEDQVWDALQFAFDNPHVMAKAEREYERAKRELLQRSPSGPSDIPSDYRTD